MDLRLFLCSCLFLCVWAFVWFFFCIYIYVRQHWGFEYTHSWRWVFVRKCADKKKKSLKMYYTLCEHRTWRPDTITSWVSEKWLVYLESLMFTVWSLVLSQAQQWAHTSASSCMSQFYWLPQHPHYLFAKVLVTENLFLKMTLTKRYSATHLMRVFLIQRMGTVPLKEPTKSALGDTWGAGF